jgi:N-acetyl sugar amidotransferase
MTSPSLKRCTRCLLPETADAITFDAEGVCSVCRNHDIKHQIDWEAKKAQLDELIETYRGKASYDCIIPFSGGKDSTFTLWYLVTQYKLKPLVVSWDHGFYRPTVLRNRERVLQKLGVDFLSFTPNKVVVKKLMLEALRRKGDFCWHCHTGIFAFPMQMAVRFGVGLVFWGEPNAEYQSYYSYDEIEEVDERRFNRYVNLGITAEDMQGMISGLTERDLEPYIYPKLKDLMKLNYRSVCLGSYIPWDVKRQVEVIQTELGWEGERVEGIPEEYYYEKIECAVQGVRDYLKYIKRGMGRTNHLVNIDIRNGRLTREEGERLQAAYDGKRPASLDEFLQYLKIDEEEFLDIAMAHQVSPWQFDPQSVPRGEKLHDQDAWNLNPDKDTTGGST